MKIRIVADSSADLRTARDRSLVSVPLKIMTDEKEYVDDEDLSVEAMTEDLATYKGKSGSACPGVGDWLDAFGDAEWIFGITITSNLSGCYNSAMVAKETYESEHPECRVYIIDSLSTGPEMQIIVEKLKEYIADGKEFDEICEAIEIYRKKTFLLFCLKSLTNLANNGRVSPAVAKIAGILGIHVVGRASEEGTLEQKDKVRGEKKAILALLKNMKEMGYRGGKVIIDHCLNETAALQLKELIKKEYANADIRIGKTGGLCSFYAERGGLLVGFES
jgi:DegV family protein with EDD domain